MPFTKVQKKKLVALGNRVKELRKERKMTLKDLAHAIGKDPQSIHRLESAGINPTYLYLLEVCNGLDVDISVLLSALND